METVAGFSPFSDSHERFRFEKLSWNAHVANSSLADKITAVYDRLQIKVVH